MGEYPAKPQTIVITIRIIILTVLIFFWARISHTREQTTGQRPVGFCIETVRAEGVDFVLAIWEVCPGHFGLFGPLRSDRGVFLWVEWRVLRRKTYPILWSSSPRVQSFLNDSFRIDGWRVVGFFYSKVFVTNEN